MTASSILLGLNFIEIKDKQSLNLLKNNQIYNTLNRNVVLFMGFTVTFKKYVSVGCIKLSKQCFNVSLATALKAFQKCFGKHWNVLFFFLNYTDLAFLDLISIDLPSNSWIGMV